MKLLKPTKQSETSIHSKEYDCLTLSLVNMFVVHGRFSLKFVINFLIAQSL